MNAPFIAPIVEQMQYKNMKEESVREQIVAFFKAYDDYKEEQVVRMQTQLDQQKQKIKKMRNEQASTFSDKTELENLFLDCIDENRKDVLRHFTNGHSQRAVRGSGRLRGAAGSSEQFKNISTKILIDQVCTSKQSRTLIFQEMFGPEQPSETDLAKQRMQTAAII